MGNITGSPLNITTTTEKTDSSLIKGYGVIDKNSKGLQSMFGKTKFTPFPSGVDDNGNSTGNIISDSNFQDISIPALIKWSKDTPYQLTFADFAYLKNVGVYPNNRLVIARRYPTPIANDLTALTKTNPTSRPLSTLISWIPPEQDFLTLNFGENWEDAAGSFETILNSIGKDLTLSADNAAGMANLGGLASKAMNAVPLPGLTEGLQRKIAINLGLADPSNGPILPVGDPNLIKKAKKRVTIDKGSAGSGLETKISIKMIVEYEQKYIDGIDPTVVYMDTIANILSFGSSNARFMWNNNFSSKTKSLLNNLISGDLNALHESIKSIIKAVISTVNDLVKSIKETIKTIGAGIVSKATEAASNATSSEDLQNKNKLTETFQKIFESSVGAIIGKYKVAILGVINSLTGSPSGYFHVQVGNPKRPTFSSGDMIVEDVTLTLGPVLSWNDLPSSIKAEFTLTNARPLGADELYSRFNNSQARAYIRNKDYYQENAGLKQQKKDANGKPTNEYTDPDVEEALKETTKEETNNGIANVRK